MNQFSIKKGRVALVLICLGFIAFGFLRLNDTSLYTDSTRYVIWGTSFSHARGFVDNTQPDPERYVVNAPLYSVVLAPVLLFFPFSLVAAKIWTLLLGACSLYLFFVWLSRRLGSTLALIGTLMLACNPLMLVMATEAMSEMCFIGLTILAMILLESLDGEKNFATSTSTSLLVILSLLPLLREVSVALVGAVVIVLLAKRHYRNAMWIALGATVLTAGWMIRNVVIVGVPPTSQSTNVNFILGHFVTPAGASILRELTQRVFLNIQRFYAFAVSLLMYPFPQPLIIGPGPLFRLFFKSLATGKYILPFLALPLVIVGVSNDIREGYTAYVRLLFCVLYAIVIALYPVQDIRFLLPLLPFFIYFLLVSIKVISNVRFLQNRTVKFGLALIAATLVILPNLDCDVELARTNWKYEHSPEDVYKTIKQTGVDKELFMRPWKPFGDWIRENLPDSTVIASTYKELAIFIGNRKILEINYGVPLPMFERLLRDNGVEYLVSAGEAETMRPYEFVMNETKRYWFEPVHSQSGLLLYRVHSSFIETPPHDYTIMAVPDTTTGRGILNKGRTLLLRGDYSQAVTDFKKAQKSGANTALTAFQLTIAYAMSDQRDEATRSLEQLYSLPQSTSYIPAATMHLRAMDTYLKAIDLSGVYQRSSQLFNVATFYWNFGYAEKGYSLLRDILKEDTTYFVALLWGWDYSKTLGDDKQADVYLKILESIDRNNAVVTGFRTINAIDDTVHHTTDPVKQSRLQLEKGKVYWSIGLFDEAFDCVERSLGEDHNDKAAGKYLADLFEKTNKPWALRKVRRMISNHL